MTGIVLFREKLPVTFTRRCFSVHRDTENHLNVTRYTFSPYILLFCKLPFSFFPEIISSAGVTFRKSFFVVAGCHLPSRTSKRMNQRINKIKPERYLFYLFQTKIQSLLKINKRFGLYFIVSLYFYSFAYVQRFPVMHRRLTQGRPLPPKEISAEKAPGFGSG